MKLVIQTQIRENYAAHTGFDGSYRWKCKGGNTYVVENVNPKQAMRIVAEGIPNLTKLIEERNDYYEEYILDWSLEDDGAVVCEEWESPIMLAYDYGTKIWSATKIQDNTGEYQFMRYEIKKRIEMWTLADGGVRENTKVFYDVGLWDWIDADQINEYLAEKEAA